VDDLDQLVEPIAVSACELDEVSCSFDDFALWRGADDGDASTAPELEQSLVAQGTERSEHGVAVDAKDGGEIPGRWEPFARLGFAVGDRSPDLGGGLLEERSRALVIEFARDYCASYASTRT
jgi:hypothetical protein